MNAVALLPMAVRGRARAIGSLSRPVHVAPATSPPTNVALAPRPVFGRAHALGSLYQAHVLAGPPAVVHELELPKAAFLPIVDERTANRLAVVHRVPTHTEEQVPLDDVIELDLVDVGDPPWATAGSLKVWVDDKLAWDGAQFVAPYNGGLSAVLPRAPNRFRLRIQPRFLWPPDTVVRVRAEGHHGGEATTSSYWFRTVDTLPPRIVEVHSATPIEVLVTFSEAVSDSALELAAYQLGRATLPSYLPALVAVTRESDRVVRLRFASELSPRRRYVLFGRAIADRRGNVIAAPHDFATFTAMELPRPAGRQFSLWRLLPELNRREDKSLDLRRLTACLQECVDLVLYDVDAILLELDPDTASEATVDRMLYDVGNPFATDGLDRAAKVRLLRILPTAMALRGTEPAIVSVARFFLGLDVAIEPYLRGGLVLGESELGVDWNLGPGTRRDRRSFDVRVHRKLTETERRLMVAIVRYLKPPNTHFVRLLEPPDESTDHVELGFSELTEAFALH